MNISWARMNYANISSTFPQVRFVYGCITEDFISEDEAIQAWSKIEGLMTIKPKIMTSDYHSLKHQDRLEDNIVELARRNERTYRRNERLREDKRLPTCDS